MENLTEKAVFLLHAVQYEQQQDPADGKAGTMEQETQKKRIAVHNLGCKVNGYEMDVMVQELLADGYSLVPFEEEADIYIINTCTVTNIADRKSRQMLHRAKKCNPDAVVVAVGCYVETDEKRIEEDPAIDLAIGNNRKNRIREILGTYLDLKEKGTEQVPDKTLGGMTQTDLTHSPEYESMTLLEPGHTRAYIKIQDGCNQFCSYCIIPYARGRIRSRDPEDVIAEIRGLAERGVREVVLTGIHVSSYGKDRGEEPESALLELMTRIQMLRGIERIRLSSMEPRIMTEGFVRGIAGLSKVCPHFHLSLQSGCDTTLKRMNRKYTTAEYLESVERLRGAFTDPAITTDVIAGFPGETQEEFEQTLEFLKKVGFYEIHVFRYSVRKGTVAAGMAGQVPEPVKAERSDRLLELTAQQAKAYRERFVGEREELLLEEEAVIDGVRYMTGHTMRYVQGYIRTDEPAGTLVSGRVTGLAGEAGSGIYLE